LFEINLFLHALEFLPAWNVSSSLVLYRPLVMTAALVPARRAKHHCNSPVALQIPELRELSTASKTSSSSSLAATPNIAAGGVPSGEIVAAVTNG
jgi:hypothetical protein